MRLSKHIFLLPVLAMWACSDDVAPKQPQPQEIYLTADICDVQSRLSYDMSVGSGIDGSGNIRAAWQLGDIIKVYETEAAGAYSDVYANFEAYNTAHPYPSPPNRDVYYRFECIGGENTTRGVFKYVGLATASVVSDPVTNLHNVYVKIKYNHAIHNWDKFQGLVIYGTPLRNQLMRTQAAKNDMSHLRFGQRMYGYICADNFQSWYDDPSRTGAGIQHFALKNVCSCVYRVIVGGLDVKVYGGSKLSLEMPGITDQAAPKNEAMTLNLGNADEFQLGYDPWYDKEVPDDAFAAYIVGWPGTLAANATATVTLKEIVSGNTYKWSLSSPAAVTFKEGAYYTIDLREHEYTKE